MILYLDSSSIVSLHLQEADRAATIELAIQTADSISCSAIAYAEVRAGLARARREARINEAGYAQARHDFQQDWRKYVRIPPSNKLVRLAGDLAEEHALRGYDAVQLASALTLRERVPDTITIPTWDNEFSVAAVREGFSLAHATT